MRDTEIQRCMHDMHMIKAITDTHIMRTPAIRRHDDGAMINDVTLYDRTHGDDMAYMGHDK
jgi:hypothetical protein